MIHFGADEWDAPLSLHEMMGTQNEKLMHYVQDYQIHLIDPAKLMEEDLNKFTSSLREVIEYIKYTCIFFRLNLNSHYYTPCLIAEKNITSRLTKIKD